MLWRFGEGYSTKRKNFQILTFGFLYSEEFSPSSLWQSHLSSPFWIHLSLEGSIQKRPQGFCSSEKNEPAWLWSCFLNHCYSLEMFSSVQLLSHVRLLQSHELPYSRHPCPSPTPGVHPNSCASSRWCRPAISSSVVPSSCPQSLPASGSFPMSQLFAWGGQSVGVSASASVLPKKSQDWSPLGWTGWISLQSKGLSRVFSNTTVQKHQFSAQLF